jgi:hypothetical protein
MMRLCSGRAHPVAARMVAGHFALDDLGLHDLKGIARRCARASRAPGRGAGRLMGAFVALAMRNKPSVDFCGYWQRASVSI